MIGATFPKIETLFERDKETFMVDEAKWRRPEFDLVRTGAWYAQEKIDGMNIRVMFNGEAVQIGGRSDNAQLPGDLVAYLQQAFPIEKMREHFPTAAPTESVTLYGEGYGPGIQKGGGDYRDSKGFILFDVKIGRWWLNFDGVRQLAREMDGVVVQSYELPLFDIVELIRRDELWSLAAKSSGKTRKAEGVIFRTEPLLLMRDGTRLIAKLKASDFRGGRK